MNYVDYLGLEGNPIKNFIEDHFPGEVINNTDSNIYGRIENNRNNVDTVWFDENLVVIELKHTLTESVNDSIPIDGLVLPDGSIYKGWSGSKVTVTEQNGTYSVKQSFGTAVINGIANVGKFIANIFLPSNKKEEYYRHYTKDQAESSPREENSIKGWDDKIQANKPDYFNQNVTNKEGCTK